MRANDIEACLVHSDQFGEQRKSKSLFIDFAGSRKAAKLVASTWLWYMNISISILTSGIAIELEIEPSPECNWEITDNHLRASRICFTNSGSLVLISTGSCDLMDSMISAYV
jgi:hypothetical protein